MIKKRRTKVILVILAIIAALAAGGYGYVYSQLNKIKHVDIPKTNEGLSINQNAEESAPEVEKIVNIALFAADTDPENEPNTTDTIMILIIDRIHNKIKLISILRDTSVNIEGYGMAKIKTAYADGGPALAIKTLNSNFNLNIKEYATVHFDGFKSIIDAVGGVDVNIKPYEWPALQSVGITSPGIHHLNGNQALRYCWIRWMGDGDFERTERQRTVLSKVYEKVRNGGIGQYPALVSAIVPYIETSMTTNEIISLGVSTLNLNVATIEQARYPIVGYYRMELSDYSLVTDLEGTSNLIHSFIYGE
jgi:polyisoprenyl-teichoic acid--peptidoglycan teichoic acid transferase